MAMEEDLDKENDVRLYLGEEHSLGTAGERKAVSEKKGENAGSKDRKDEK